MYQNYDNVEWLSQIIFSHRDTIYGTDGFMRVSISTQTKDSNTFSAPTFTINIQNEGVNKTAVLSYQKIFEIYNLLKQVVQEAGEEYTNKTGNPDVQLHYKTGKSAFLTFEFLRGSQQNEPVVRITISHGTSNSTKIIMPFSPEFYSFISLIGDMVGNRKYLDWCLNFPNRFYLQKFNDIIQQLPMLIKTAVVQIDNASASTETPTESTPNIENNETPVDSGNVQKATETMQELNAFVGEDMSNIDIEFIDGKKDEKPVGNDVSDKRILKWIKNDLKNYEKILLRCGDKEDPLSEIEIEVMRFSNAKPFPNITDKEVASLVYVIARERIVINKQANVGPVGRNFPINKYKGYKHATPEHLDIAYDLLLFNMFLKLCRDKIENKTSDNYVNKTFVNIMASLFVSPFIFSYLKDGTELGTILSDRFRQYDNLGLFDSYKEDEFKSFDFNILERDIREQSEKLQGEYFNSQTYHTDAVMKHTTAFNSGFCFLDPNSGINGEQIIKTIIPFESAVIFEGLEPTNHVAVDKYIKEHNAVLLKELVKKKPTRKFPIVKFFENHEDEIPENIRHEFITFLDGVVDKDFDLTDKKFPYDSFGDEAVKALFMWKPESGKQYNSYKKFLRDVTQATHDKNTILSMLTHGNDVTNESFADFYSQATGKEK